MKAKQSELKYFVPFTKSDEERIVEGYASTAAVDNAGDVVDLEAIANALPDYMKFANIREMHQLSAVGVTEEATMDEKGLLIKVRVVDDNAWQKVKSGVYKGFSIGAYVKKRAGKVIKDLILTEISLVDRPCNPEALISLWKTQTNGEVEMNIEKVEDQEQVVEESVEKADEVAVVEVQDEVLQATEDVQEVVEKAEEVQEEVAHTEEEAVEKSVSAYTKSKLACAAEYLSDALREMSWEVGDELEEALFNQAKEITAQAYEVIAALASKDADKIREKMSWFTEYKEGADETMEELTEKAEVIEVVEEVVEKASDLKALQDELNQIKAGFEELKKALTVIKSEDEDLTVRRPELLEKSDKKFEQGSEVVEVVEKSVDFSQYNASELIKMGIPKQDVMKAVMAGIIKK